MADLVFIVILAAFFGLAVLLVRACDRILGADTETRGAPDQTQSAEQAAA